MEFLTQSRSGHAEPIRGVHPEPMRFAQGELREASLGPSRETLPLRFTQGFGSCAEA
jgi:hypothetical protein